MIWRKNVTNDPPYEQQSSDTLIIMNLLLINILKNVLFLSMKLELSPSKIKVQKRHFLTKKLSLFYHVNYGLSIIASKVSQKHEQWCFCCLQDKKWIKMPKWTENRECLFSLLKRFMSVFAKEEVRTGPFRSLIWCNFTF